MISLLHKKRYTPIGIDFGSRSVKLVQFDLDSNQLLDAARWDFPLDVIDTPNPPPQKEDELDLKLSPAPAPVPEQQTHYDTLTETVQKGLVGRRFRGKDAVLCLGTSDLFIQNIRIPKSETDSIDRLIYQEVAGRISFPVDLAEIRYIEAGDVRQGDSMRREVIVLAIHRQVLEKHLRVITDVGLRPVAVDVEPLAMMRSYVKQFRREEDYLQRTMFVHIGASRTSVVISEGNQVLFIKYLDVGGLQMDLAVASHLKMELSEAIALRRHNGDRRTAQQDPEVARSVLEGTRPIIDQLISELSMCLRYHSVTFRGKPVVRLILGGGEASSTLCDTLSQPLDLACELGNPLRSFEVNSSVGRITQWDIATGLALKGEE